MIGALIASTILLWIIVIALALTLVAALRQIGVLHERLGPVGALTLSGGPRPGEQAPVLELKSMDGGDVRIGPKSDGRSTLLFFVSPNCPVCKSLIPVVKSISKERAEALDLVFASDGDVDAQREFIIRERLDEFPMVISTQLGIAFRVSKLPHAVLIDPAGKIVAKGLVNNREHIESLFNAGELGIASLQEFRARKVQ